MRRESERVGEINKRIAMLAQINTTTDTRTPQKTSDSNGPTKTDISRINTATSSNMSLNPNPTTDPTISLRNAVITNATTAITVATATKTATSVPISGLAIGSSIDTIDMDVEGPTHSGRGVTYNRTRPKNIENHLDSSVEKQAPCAVSNSQRVGKPTAGVFVGLKSLQTLPQPSIQPQSSSNCDWTTGPRKESSMLVSWSQPFDLSSSPQVCEKQKKLGSCVQVHEYVCDPGSSSSDRKACIESNDTNEALFGCKVDDEFRTHFPAISRLIELR